MAIEIAPRIVVDSAIHFGKPVIKRTRVPVDVLIGKLASGVSAEEVADEYEVTSDDVQAALRYAAASDRSGRPMVFDDMPIASWPSTPLRVRQAQAWR